MIENKFKKIKLNSFSYELITSPQMNMYIEELILFLKLANLGNFRTSSGDNSFISPKSMVEYKANSKGEDGIMKSIYPLIARLGLKVIITDSGFTLVKLDD